MAHTRHRPATHRPRGVVAALLLAAAPTLAAGCSPSPAARAALDALTPAWPEHLLAEVNALRASTGAPPLSWCPNLAAAAEAKADAIAATGRLSHTGAGGNLAQRVEAAGYRGWTALSENLAAGSTTVAAVTASWARSPQHRRNLLDPAMTHHGAGVAADAGGRLHWVQDFGRGGSC